MEVFSRNIDSKLDRLPPPDVTLIQLGSNDVDVTKTLELINSIDCDVLRLMMLLPNVKIIWSEILDKVLALC